MNTQALANALSKKEDQAFLRGGVQKNQNNDSDYLYTGNNYTGLQDNTQQNGDNMSLSGALGVASKIKGYTGGGGGASGSAWGAAGTAAKTGYNAISGKDDTDYSDLEQSTIYPLQGAAAGSQFGPWGAAGGALYGLGYSLKDNIGLEDNDWLTTLIFPIGMGDEHEGLISL